MAGHEQGKSGQIPYVTAIPLERRTLFDDYYLAAIQGVATGFGNIVGEGMSVVSEEIAQQLPNIFSICARELAIEALKRREEYFAKEEKPNE